MMRVTAFFLVLIVVGCSSCSSSLDPALPGAVRFAPSDTIWSNLTWGTAPDYLRPLAWHHRVMERCSGLRRDFKAIEWYAFHGVSLFRSPAGDSVQSHWDGGKRIYLAGTPTLPGEWTNGFLPVVYRVQMLNYLIGNTKYDSTYFGGSSGTNGLCSFELGHVGATARFPELPQ